MFSHTDSLLSHAHQSTVHYALLEICTRYWHVSGAAHIYEDKVTIKNRGGISDGQRFYFVMSTILALEELFFTDSTPFMQLSLDS